MTLLHLTAPRRMLALTALAGGLALVALPGPAAARPVDCDLTINGRSYTGGSCEFESLGSDGSFMLNGGQGIFVYVNTMRPGVAEASWNERPSSTHAQAPLGEVRRNGACWQNQRVNICAWTPGQRPAAAPAPTPAPAPAPRGSGPISFFLRDDPSLCLQAAGRLQDGTPITAGDCASRTAAFVPEPDRWRIRFAANNEFCLGFTYSGAAQVLQCGSVEQEYRYAVNRQQIRFRNDEGGPSDCVGLRGPLQAGGRFVIERCSDASDQAFTVGDPIQAAAPAPPPAAAPAPAPRSAGRQVVFFTQTSDTMCIRASRIQSLAPIVIGSCQGNNSRFVVDGPASRIRFAADPRLCLGIDVGGESTASVWPCDDVQVDLRWDAGRESIRRTDGNDCIGLPGQPNSPPSGTRVQLETCNRGNDQKFMLSDPPAQ